MVVFMFEKLLEDEVPWVLEHAVLELLHLVLIKLGELFRGELEALKQLNRMLTDLDRESTVVLQLFKVPKQEAYQVGTMEDF